MASQPNPRPWTMIASQFLRNVAELNNLSWRVMCALEETIKRNMDEMEEDARFYEEYVPTAPVSLGDVHVALREYEKQHRVSLKMPSWLKELGSGNW